MTQKRVIVIGGGAAGMMAACQAAELDAETVLLEKMDRPGRKLLLTGKGRCNLTNVAPLHDFIEHFGRNGRFLRPAFSRFFSPDLIEFFERLGVRTVTERGGRVFPVSEKAADVVNALTGRLRELGVAVHTRSPVERLLVEHGRVVGAQVSSSDAHELQSKAAPDYDPKVTLQTVVRLHRADATILATGGASYPGTGSTGDGYRLAEAVGHTIVPIRPALVPLVTAGDVAGRLEGLSLRNVAVRVWIDGRKSDSAFGEMLFTSDGLSGPIILTLSGGIVDALRDRRRVEVSIDLKPALDERQLDARLLRDFEAHGKRQFHTLLDALLPASLVPVCIDLVGVAADKTGNQITADERRRLRVWLKDFRLQVTAAGPFAEAIVTAGGVDTREIDPRTMASRVAAGLYFAGEAIDVDADTGGYNLQAAFSTGCVAGRAAAT